MRLLRGKQTDAPTGGDQAGRLRRLVASPAEAGADRLPIVAVIGAKGGVGATSVTWQLTQALGEAGRSPLAVDAHLWQPELARVAGVALADGPTVVDVLAERAKPAAAVRVGDGPALLPGAWSNTYSPDDAQEFGPRLHKALVLRRRERKGLGDRFDTLVVDGGPGRSPWAVSLMAVADLVLMVATPDHLSLLGAYSLIKLASDSENAPPVRLIVNRCVSESQGRAAHAGVRDTCRQHLQTSLAHAGWLPHDARLASPAAPAVPLARPLCRRVCEALDNQETTPQPIAKAA